MTLQLFIFDFDGVLVDSGPWMAEAFNSAATHFGLRQVSRRDLETLRGRDNRTILRELGVPLWRLPQIAGYVRQLAQEAPSAPLFPGIQSMLRQLHASKRTLAIVSSNAEATIRRALTSDCEGLIDLYACNASLFGKAAKFKRVMQRTGIGPNHTIAIGDETRDIEAARKAQIASGAVIWGYATSAVLQAQKPDFLFKTPEDIVALGERPA